MIHAHRQVRHPDRLRRRPRRTAAPAVFSGTIFRLRPRVEWMEDRTLLSTFLVTNTGDSGPGSLRQAILDSNAAIGATNTIDFDIAGSGVQTIVPLSPLPAIANPVLIDGCSQPGYGGTPLIEINGSQAGGGDGLLITGCRMSPSAAWTSTASRQGAGIHITGAGATGDWVYGNFLGTDPTGTQAEPNEEGVEIDGGASGNLIGSNGDGVERRGRAEPDQRQHLRRRGDQRSRATDGNAIAGNFIGTTFTGRCRPGQRHRDDERRRLSASVVES